MNLGALKTGVRRYGFDDDDPLAMWINAALHEIEIAAEWPFLETEAGVVIVNGQNTFSHPPDFVKPLGLRDITGDQGTRDPQLRYIDYNRFQREISDWDREGKPEIFTIFEDNIFIYPVADSQRSLALDYRRSIPELVDEDDVPDLPIRHHYTLVRGAAYIALQAENEEERAQTAQGQFEADLVKAIEFYSLRQLGEMETIADAQGYGDDFLGY